MSWVGLGLALVGLVAQVLAAEDFHHTDWRGLGAVFDLKQSSEGYIWLTTSRGVLRFDGVRFQSIEEVTRGAVRNSEIDSVFLASSGGLWLTTEGAGVLLWKDGRLTNFPDRRCTPARKQGKLIEDRDGSLWVQATAGLFRLRGNVCEQVGAEQGYPGGFPAGLLLDSDGTLWVKTRTSALFFLPRGASKFQATGLGEGVSTDYAYLHEAPDGAIWLSDDQGLRQVATKLSSSTASPAPRARNRKHAGKHPVRGFCIWPGWFAVGHNCAWAFREMARQWLTAPGEDFTPAQGLSSDAVWKILADREGVWVATNSGLDALRRAALTAIRLPPAQEREFGVAAGDQGSVWTGNSSLPLTHVAADGTIMSFPHIRQVESVRRDHAGTIWLAGTGDFRLWRSPGDRSSGDGFSGLHYPGDQLDPVVFTASDRGSDAWITTLSGRAYRLSGGAWSDETQALGKKPGVVGAMVDDQEGNVWFAFSNKVVEWDGTSYHRFAFPDGQRRRLGKYHVGARGSRVAGRRARRSTVPGWPLLPYALEGRESAGPIVRHRRDGKRRSLAEWLLGHRSCFRIRAEKVAPGPDLGSFRRAPR